MSAQNKQLQWVDITDFSPGLTTVGGDMLEPATGASVMDDVLVSPYGGLKAAMRAVSLSIAGIANPTTLSLAGMFVRGGVGDFAAQSDRYLWVHDGANLKIYRWDESIPAASWALISTIALASGTMNGVVADTFVDENGTEFVVFNLFQSGGNDGVWTIQRDNNSVINRLAIPCTCVVVQDDIIIAANGATLRWSASQTSSSWPTENNLPVQVSRQGAIIVTMNAFAPSDLLIGNGFAPWVLVQGEITQPLVRNMSNARTPQAIQRTPQTSSGIAFMGPRQGVFLTTDGNQFNDISRQLKESTWLATAAPIGFSNNMLLAASGGGYIYDERTQVWHRTTAITGQTSHAHGVNNVSEIFAATKLGSVFTLWRYDADLTDLAGSWTWTSVPLRSEGGRQIAIREVQIYAESFDSNATVAVTVGGIEHSITITNASKQHLSYRFLARDETLDVQVTCTAGTAASNEAPSVEVVRVGYTTGHLLLP